jgi:hypothetical protein
LTQNGRSACHLLGRLTWAIAIAACALVGPLSVSASADEKDPIEEARKKAADYADKLYGTTMKLNKDVATAINLVRAVIKEDPFAVIDILLDLMSGGDAGPPDLTVRQATQKIIAEIRTEREEELRGRAESLISRMGNLIIDPQSMTFNDRLAIYIEDASDLFYEVKTIMNNGDLERADLVYSLAPTFNAVASSQGNRI